MNAPNLETATAVSAHVGDKIRHKALYCGFGSALIVYELLFEGRRAKLIPNATMFTANDLIKVSDRLSLGIPKATIYRGLNRADLGAAIFFSKSERVIHPYEDKPSESEKKSTGRQKAAYKVRSKIDVQDSLNRAVRITSIRKHFPTVVENELLPDLDEITLENLIHSIGKHESEAPDLIKDWKIALKMQDQVATQRAIRAAKRDVNALDALDDTLSSQLTPGWVNVNMYRAILKRAEHEAAPDERVNYSDHARLYGIKPTSTPALLKRAGLKNDKASQIIEKPLDPEQDAEKQIRQFEAELRGKCYDLNYDSDCVATAAVIRASSKQMIVGAVAVPKPPARKAIETKTQVVSPFPGSKPRKERAPRRSLNAHWFVKKLELVKMRLNKQPFDAFFLTMSQPDAEDRALPESALLASGQHISNERPINLEVPEQEPSAEIEESPEPEQAPRSRFQKYFIDQREDWRIAQKELQQDWAQFKEAV